MGYDPKKTVGKFVKHALMTLGSIAAVAIVGYLSDAGNIRALLGDSPYALLAIPMLTGLFGALQNWLKHRNQSDTVSLPR